MTAARKTMRNSLKETMKHLTVLVDTYYLADNPQLDQLLRWSNDCYNEVMYLIRQRYFKNCRIFKHELWLYKRGILTDPPKFGKSYTLSELSKMIRLQSEQGQNTLHRDCVNKKIINSVVRSVLNNWSNYFKAKSDFKRHPYKYLAAPKIPGYLKSGKRHSTELDTQTIKIHGNYIVYDKLGLKVRMSPYLQEAVYGNSNDLWLNKLSNKQRIRNYWLKPLTHGAKLCVSYVVSSKPLTSYKGKQVPDRISGIVVSADPGVDNLMTLATNNFRFHPLIINGKGVKSVNHFYNKQKAYLQRRVAQLKQNGILIHKNDGTSQMIYLTGQRCRHLTEWRSNKILTAIHKATDRILEYAINCGAEKIIVGRNKYWKQKSRMSKKNNQNFVSIPHFRVVQILKYKASRYGITVETQPEAYTSQTSFLDHEKPIWKNGNKARKTFHKSPINRRIHRGLFKTNNGLLINADVNGAYQIMIKNQVSCDWSNLEQVIGCVLHPVKWSPHF